jgi:hypothetical protein
MTRSLLTRLACATGIAITAVTAGVTSSAAAQSIVLPAGVACTFELGIDIVGGNQVFREFRDENGNVVRTLSAGKGSALTFTNLDTGATLSLQPNGSVSQVRINPDGSQIWTTTGHNVLILFPSDVPAGPSTTLTVGLTVFTVDSSGVFTVQQISGVSTDICAALSA